MSRDPDLEELRLQCLKLAVALQHGDEVRLAREFYAFVVGEDAEGSMKTLKAVLADLERAQLSTSDSSRDNLAASERAPSIDSATRATTICEDGCCSPMGSKSDSRASSDGAENANITTPPLEAMTGTASAKSGGGSEPTIGGLADGIYVVSEGNLTCIHAGAIPLVKRPDGWLGA